MTRRIRVKHPEYGAFLAESVKDKLSAAMMAGKAWGVQWSQIAKECEYEEAEPVVSLKTKYTYEVKHPDYGTALVVAEDPGGATLAAAEQWGVRDLWTQMAAECAVSRGGKAQKPRCTRCQREMTSDNPARICLSCQNTLKMYKREKAAIRRPDKRAGQR